MYNPSHDGKIKRIFSVLKVAAPKGGNYSFVGADNRHQGPPSDALRPFG
tara:strand:+ start:20915 stop:21061 length:147 start_codon:yes stop_codon:yes gene_type:complete